MTEVVEDSEIAVDILAYMTDQRKEYSDNYDYEDYIDTLDDKGPYTSYSGEKDKVRKVEEEYTYRDSSARREAKVRDRMGYRGYRGYNNGYRNADQNAAGTFVVQGGGGGHSGSGYGHSGCGGGYTTSLGLCEILAAAGLVAVAAAAFGALALALGLGRRRRRSLSDWVNINIVQGNTVFNTQTPL